MDLDSIKQYRINPSDPFFNSRFSAIIAAQDEDSLIDVAIDECFKAEYDIETISQVISSIAFNQNLRPSKRYNHLIKLFAKAFIESDNFRTKQKYALLIELLSFSNESNSEIITVAKQIASSEYVNIRKIAYRIAERDTQQLDLYSNIIEQAYKTYHDYNCIRIIVRKMPKLCERNLSELTKDTEGYLLKDLYLSVKLDATKLQLLKKADEITYLYVAAIKGIGINENEAEQIWNNNINDERWGIMLFSIGKLKLLDLLTRLPEPTYPKNDLNLQ